MCRTLIFWRNVAKFKRCVESKRTLKNLFAPRLAEFDTTLKVLRIADQWYIVSVKFRFERNRDFLALLSLLLAGGPRKGKRFNASLRLISPTSFHTSSDNRERNTQKWNSNNKHYVRMKPSRHGCDRGDLVELNSVKHSLQRRVSKLLIKLPYGRQNQTNRHYMFRETSAMKSQYDVWITFARLRLVEIAFLFISFELLRLERNQILLDLDLPQNDLWHEFHSNSRKAV